MKLLFATGNDFKYSLMKKRLEPLEKIEVITPKVLDIKIEVEEDGKTEEENAIKKAKAYYEKTKMPVIAEDSGLYIDKFSKEEQPRLFVKRINGREDATDAEVLQYYIDKLNQYGGESLACYHTGVCIIDKKGNIYSNIIVETKFLLTAKKCNLKYESGGILSCISYDIEANKYFEERNEIEKNMHWKKLDEEYRNIIKENLLK